MDKTIIYITDNNLDERIDKICKKYILKSIGDYPLISVSQKPIDFGKNICVGVLPRSSLSINLQMMEALKIVKTEHIAIAEHDCLYTPEHFKFEPKDDSFYYNGNIWCLQVFSIANPQYNGMFSIFKDRKANSQLICRTDMMIKATQERIDLMSDPAWLTKYPTGRIGEAGVMDYDHAMKLSRGKSVSHLRERLQDYCTKYKGVNFYTTIPNVDIRHDKNLTKNRRGTKRTYKIPYWGTMEDLWK